MACVGAPLSTSGDAGTTSLGWGIASLIVTVGLCLPSLLGGTALVVQAAAYGPMSNWKDTPSALVALGAILGAPLVAMATVLGGIISFTRVPTPLKYAHISVVSAAAIATMSLLFRFAK